MTIQGSITALVTPFRAGIVDFKALTRLVEFQIVNGTSAIVPCGTTGESATLTHREHNNVIEAVVDAVQHRIPVIAGTGSNSTEEAVTLTHNALELGADAALIITPYYNKPSQEGLYRHYKAIAQAVDVPIILYNVPGRTCVNMSPETVERLCEFPQIIGIKEASGNLDQVAEICRRCGDRLTILSGDDALTVPIIMNMGGKGVISVASNVVPKKMAELVQFCRSGNWEQANVLDSKMQALFKALFVETNPVPVKQVLEFMGLISSEVRLPLCTMSKVHLDVMQTLLQDSLQRLLPSQVVDQRDPNSLGALLTLLNN